MANSSLSNIPLEWIRAFEAAGRTGSFTAAARETGLTQAAVSQRIGNLEARIGAALFIRKARGVTLTVEGEAWLPYVTAALQELEQSYQGLFGTARDTVTISASASIIQLWLVPLLQAWKAEVRPQISFSTMVLQSEKLHTDVTVQVRYGNGDWPDYHKVPLFEEVLSPVCSPALLKNGCDWQELPKIAISGPRSDWREWAARTGGSATPVPKIRFDSFASGLSAALAGAGVLLGSLPLCRPMLDDGSLVLPSELEIKSQETYWMIARKDGIPSRQWEALANGFAAGGQG